MRIRHILPGTSCRKEVEGDRAFFLHNSIGNMLSWYTTPQSRYEGWFVRGGTETFIKLLERISLGDSANLPVTAITSTSDTVFWEYANNLRLSYMLLPKESGLTVSLSTPSQLEIVLDIRKIYSYPDFQREYIVSNSQNSCLISYTDPHISKPVFLHIRSKDSLSLKNEWKPQDYPRDAIRNSPPSELYVYTLLATVSDTLGFGFGSTREEAETHSLEAFGQLPKSPEVSISYTHDTLFNEVSAAKIASEKSLQALITNKGMWAGLPWFHQIWSRDELITALGIDKKQQLDCIQRYLTYPLQNGELPTFQGSKSTCADGVGWLCLLIREYGIEIFSDTDSQKITEFLKQAHSGLIREKKASHGFIYSGYNATWMDTIGRTGYRIEIQCMYALLLELLYELTTEELYKTERTIFLKRLKQEFYVGGQIKDGLHDSSLRPNQFLAYLLQPELLSPTLWHSAFKKALAGLKTSWGGLSTLSPHHPDFQPVSTGEDNRSYHNGDSWFFINNLAAIALIRLDRQKYTSTIVDLLQSSTDDILWQQVIGGPSEISSATTLDSYGCHTQAWSAGTYLALLQEFEDYSGKHDTESLSSFWESSSETRTV